MGRGWGGGGEGVGRARSAAGGGFITFGYQAKASGKDTGDPSVGRSPDLKADA